MTRLFALIATLIAISACGVASVSPFVTSADAVSEPRLIGSWQDQKGRESAVITAASEKGSYSIVYTDEDAKVGRFDARLGRIGTMMILDVQPVDPLPSANDVYRSLLLRTHGVVIIDSITNVLAFRLVSGDSLKPYLRAHPELLDHTLVDNSVLFTASSEDSRRFLTEFLRRPGALEEGEIWRRKR